jgi:hypothetical protein
MKKILSFFFFLEKTPTTNFVYNEILKFARWGLVFGLLATGLNYLMELPQNSFKFFHYIVLGCLGMYVGYLSTQKFYPNGVPPEYKEEQKEKIQLFLDYFKRYWDSLGGFEVHYFDFDFKYNTLTATLGTGAKLTPDALEMFTEKMKSQLNIPLIIQLESYDPFDPENLGIVRKTVM